MELSHVFDVAPAAAYLILAILLVIAAFAKDPLNLGGVIKTTNSPSAATRTGFAVGAAFLIAAGVYTYVRQQHTAIVAQWYSSYNELLDGADGHPPPWSPARQFDQLNELASLAETDSGENCLIAAFIYDHRLPHLPWLVALHLQEADKSSQPEGYLSCYAHVIKLAKASLAGNHGALAAFAPQSPATTILAALSTQGRKGWVPANVVNALPSTLGEDAVYLYAAPAKSTTEDSVSAVAPFSLNDLKVLGTTQDQKWKLVEVIH